MMTECIGQECMDCLMLASNWIPMTACSQLGINAFEEIAIEATVTPGERGKLGGGAALRKEPPQVTSGGRKCIRCIEAIARLGCRYW